MKDLIVIENNKPILASRMVDNLIDIEKKIKELKAIQDGYKKTIKEAMEAKGVIKIADEPTGALDSENTDSLMDLLLELNRQGITIIIVSHDPKVAMRCPIRYRIEDGRIE